MASTADIKNGVVLNMDGQLWTVIEFQHVKPGKGGAFVRTKVKNVMSGKVVDRTFNAGAKIETETVDRRDFQYLYADGENFVFMDTSDYDQITLSAAQVGDAKNFMLENQDVTVALHNGEGLYVELPASVETGHQIQVPLFLEQGTRVKVDTRTGDYLGRVTD
jgi:elongation factor P